MIDRRITSCVLAVALVLTSAIAAVAQTIPTPCGCQLALMPDEETVTSSKQTSLAALSLIDESSYKLVQRDVSASGKAVVELVPVGADASYKDFSEARSALLKKQNFSATEGENLATVTKHVSSQALEVFGKCQMACIAANTNGLHIVPISVQKDHVVAQVTWRPSPPVMSAKVSAAPSVIGGSLKDPGTTPFVKDGELPPNSEYTLVFTRSRGEPLSIVINLANGLGTGTLNVPAYEEHVVTVVEQVVEIKSTRENWTQEFAFTAPMDLAELRTDGLDAAHFHTLYELCMLPYSPIAADYPLGRRWKISFRRQFVAEGEVLVFRFKIKGTNFSDLPPEKSPQRCP